MDKATAFAMFEEIKASFLSLIEHPEGGDLTKKDLRNVDAEIIRRGFIVFKNKEDKYIVVPVSVETVKDSTYLPENKRRPSLPTRSEVERNYMTEILEALIRARTYESEEDKSYVLNCFPDWIEKSPSNPENRKKIEMYESLKKDLSDLGLIENQGTL